MKVKLDINDTFTLKRSHARAYIKDIAREYADSLPAVGDSEGASTNRRVIPYDSITSFFKEYQHYCECTRVEPETWAGKTLFREVF